MAACMAVACVWDRGFMPAASDVPEQHATPPGLVSCGPIVFSLPCHTVPLVLVMVSDFPLGNFACLPCPGNTTTVPPSTFTALGVAVDGCFSILLGVEVSLLSYDCSLLGLCVFPLGCTTIEVFWFVVFRPVRSSVVSTHSTGHLGVGQGQRAFAQGMRDGQ